MDSQELQEGREIINYNNKINIPQTVNVLGNIWMTIITQRLERVVDAKTVVIVLTSDTLCMGKGW